MLSGRDVGNGFQFQGWLRVMAAVMCKHSVWDLRA